MNLPVGRGHGLLHTNPQNLNIDRRDKPLKQLCSAALISRISQVVKEKLFTFKKVF